MSARRNPLFERTPAQWRKLITALPRPLAGAVAAIVWWDFFSNRFAHERWAELDGVIGSAATVTDDELIAGLVAIGYTPERARRRIFATRPSRKEAA
jgi:hypothetical protein